MMYKKKNINQSIIKPTSIQLRSSDELLFLPNFPAPINEHGFAVDAVARLRIHVAWRRKLESRQVPVH